MEREQIEVGAVVVAYGETWTVARIADVPEPLAPYLCRLGDPPIRWRGRTAWFCADELQPA